jgi:hypothetical protein
MAKLPVGWSHGEGIPVDRSAIALGEIFVYVGTVLELEVDVFPNLDGGCAVAFYREDVRLEVSINSTGNYDLRIERGLGPYFDDVIPCKENAHRDLILHHLFRLAEHHRWSLPGYSTYASTTVVRGASGIWSTKTPPRSPVNLLLTDEGGYQSSKRRVPVGV